MSGPQTDHLKIIELSELTGGLAHEIRNPLSTLKVNLQLLAEEFRDPQRSGAMDADLRRRTLQRLGTLLSETDRLQHLLDNYLNLVSRREISTQPLDLNGVVRLVCDFFAPRAREQAVDLRMGLAPQPLVCDVDDALLRQALLNLCVNAVQAMPKGGELIIETAADHNRARIDVTDTGLGIAPDVLPNLFKPFYSTKQGGSGLGLSLTRRIISEHGGSITVQSDPGKGSRFSVQLPLRMPT